MQMKISSNNISKKILIIFLLLIFFINTITNINVYAESKQRYCIEVTPQITDAAYNYLNEIYIKKYPRLATEFSFGTQADKEVLKKLAKIITKGIKNDKEKSIAISNWISDNVQYSSYEENETSYFAIDAFYRRKANCLGYAHLLSQLCRLSGIPAVICGGTRGDMEHYVTLDNRQEDHEWTMVYYNNDWHLFDPLFGVKGKTNKNYISKWYFFEDIEGITPHVAGYEKYFHSGYNTFYINNRFMNYINELPATKFTDGMTEGGLSYNEHMPFFSKTKYLIDNGNCADGFDYIDSSTKRDKMINDECYSNGWIAYITKNEPEYYAKENGVLAQCTLKKYNNQLYYLPYGQSALKINGNSSDYTLTDGLMTLKVGDTINLQPTWIQSQLDDGKIICWESLFPETAKVDKNGKITALKEGYARIDVYSKYNKGEETTYAYEVIELMISSKDRKANYKTDIIKDKCDVKVARTTKTYTGQNIKPNVTVKYNYKELKKDVDYTVTYENNKKVGTATIIIKFKGNYSGKIKKTFKIVPKKTSVKELSAKRNGFKIKLNKQTIQTTGYQIQYATNNKFSSNKKTVTISKNKEISKTISNLKANKKYYIRVRTYKTVNNKKYYSSWSKVKTVKTKK